MRPCGPDLRRARYGLPGGWQHSLAIASMQQWFVRLAGELRSFHFGAPPAPRFKCSASLRTSMPHPPKKYRATVHDQRVTAPWLGRRESCWSFQASGYVGASRTLRSIVRKLETSRSSLPRYSPGVRRSHSTCAEMQGDPPDACGPLGKRSMPHGEASLVVIAVDVERTGPATPAMTESATSSWLSLLWAARPARVA
jgi:hypothetical protein